MAAAQATSATEPTVMITLVHGTFARGAPWTGPDSALRRGWPAAPERPASFSVFEWSGGNSHRDRVAAADELADHLASLMNQHKAASHLVIAHSHGGNVALGALGQDKVKDKVEALICLNTPFLHCMPRNLIALMAVLIALNPIALLALAWTPFFELYLLPRYPGEYWRPLFVGAGLLMVLLIPAGLLGFIFWRFTSRVLRAVEDYQAHASTKFVNTADPGCHVLAATVERDEAYRYLWLLDRITAATTVGAQLSFLLCAVGLVLLLLAGSGGFLTDFNWFPSLTQAAMVMARYGAMAIVGGIVLFVISSVLMTVTCAVLRRHRFSYGEQIADSLFLRIFVKPYPPIKADLRYLEGTPGGLRHSALYGSPEVVASLAEWFEGLPKTAHVGRRG